MSKLCEWCSSEIDAHIYYEYSQKWLDSIFKDYNEALAEGDNTEASRIWKQHARNCGPLFGPSKWEWPQVGDKRGYFCSNKCSTESGELGEWHSRGIISWLKSFSDPKKVSSDPKKVSSDPKKVSQIQKRNDTLPEEVLVMGQLVPRDIKWYWSEDLKPWLLSKGLCDELGRGHGFASRNQLESSFTTPPPEHTPPDEVLVMGQLVPSDLEYSYKCWLEDNDDVANARINLLRPPHEELKAWLLSKGLCDEFGHGDGWARRAQLKKSLNTPPPEPQKFTPMPTPIQGTIPINGITSPEPQKFTPTAAPTNFYRPDSYGN